MNTDQFFEKVRQSSRPVVVDLWAPWCGPCKAGRPALEKLEQEYAGRVDLWEINSDDHADLVRALGVYGIPTLIVYQGGTESARYVGAKPAAALRSLFEALATGEMPAPAQIAARDRILRLAIGLVLLVLGWSLHVNAILVGLLGSVVMFTAVYDRCPIWRAITAYFKKQSAG